ncbi:hypothetical protein BGZ51_004547 [Haplosporangium sp. Z 767]|nr:hypothetical protein BGZ51_004547 [Haplosporangium sp. Z 767]
MEQPSTRRFQPYARPSAVRRHQPVPVRREQDNYQNIPKVIVSFVKKSLSWLGITPPDILDAALEEELNTTKGDFEILPAADKDSEEQIGTSKKNYTTTAAAPVQQDEERLYPDLRDEITDLKSNRNKHGLVRAAKRQGYDDDDAMTDLMSEERVAHRRKVQKALMDSLDKPESDDEVIATPFSNPFYVREGVVDIGSPAPVQQPPKVRGLQESLALRHDIQDEMEPDDDNHDGLLSQAELALLGRVRKLTEATSWQPAHSLTESASKPETKPLDTILPYNKDYRRNRRAAQTTRQDSNEMTIDSGNSGSDADESEHATNDVRERSRRYSSARQHRLRETPTEPMPASPERRRRSSRPEFDEDQRTSRGGLQVRSQVTPKRHVRIIPGRFSALDSDEEEEDLRYQEEVKVQRMQATPSSSWIHPASQGALPIDAYGVHGHQGSSGSAHGQQEHQGFLGFRVPPQLYPTLNYGRRTKLYHPMLDEVLKWTSSGGPEKPLVLDTWRCRSCDHRTNVASSRCDFCQAPKPGPVVFNTTPVAELKAAQKEVEHKEIFSAPSLVSAAISAAPVAIGALAAVAGAAGIASAVSNGAFSGFKLPDTSNKWKCPTCDVFNDNAMTKCPCCETLKPGEKKVEAKASGIPALFTPSFGASSTSTSTTAAPASVLPANPTAAEQDKDQNKEKPAPTRGWADIGFKIPDTSNKWKCPACDVMNENDKIKCPCCETLKPGAKVELKVPSMPALFTPSFGSSAPSSTPAATVTSVAPPTFSFGKPVEPALSSSASTTAPSVPALFGASSSTSTADKPVSANTGTPSIFAGFKGPDTANKWKCPTCDVFNNNDIAKCPCCETAKPGGAAVETGAPAASVSSTAPSLFSFKPPSSTGAPSSTPSLFGGFTPSASASRDAVKPAAPSLFGAPSASTSVESKDNAVKPPMFTFNAPGTAATTSGDSDSKSDAAATPATSVPAPSFVNPFTSKATGASAPSLFGAASAPASSAALSSTETPKTSVPPVFSFGGSAATTSMPLFGATSTAPASSAASPFGTTATSASTAPASTPLFGAPSSAPASTSLFGASTPTAPLFGTASTTSAPSAAATSAAPVPLFGASSAAAAPTSTTATTNPFGSVTTSPFAFGAKPVVSFGQSTAATSSTPLSAPTSAPMSTPIFAFGANSSTPAASTTGPSAGTGFGSTAFGGFGPSATGSSTAVTSAATATPTSTPGVGFTLGGAASQPSTTAAPTFSFSGSSGNTGFGAGSSASASPFAFGGNTGGATFSGFGASTNNATTANNNNNSMMSPTISAATPSMGNTTGSGFSGFGATPATATPTMNFGASTPSVSFGVGGSLTPSSGFGAATGGAQATPFGQTSTMFGTGANQGTGFGSTAPAFGASSGTGFGASSGAQGGGFISVAGQGGSTPAFGTNSAPSFGGGMQASGGGFGGFGANAGTNPGSFGFQGASNAPGGSQYTQPAPQQQPLTGNFAFNMGAAPAADNIANRKIAKMRTKKR